MSEKAPKGISDKEKELEEFASYAIDNIEGGKITVPKLVLLRAEFLRRKDEFLDDPSTITKNYVEVSKKISEAAEKLGIGDRLDELVYVAEQQYNNGATIEEIKTYLDEELAGKHEIELNADDTTIGRAPEMVSHIFERVKDAVDIGELNRLVSTHSATIPEERLAEFDELVRTKRAELQMIEPEMDYTADDLADSLREQEDTKRRQDLSKRISALKGRVAEMKNPRERKAGTAREVYKEMGIVRPTPTTPEDKQSEAERIKSELEVLATTSPKYTEEVIEDMRRRDANVVLKTEPEEGGARRRSRFGGLLKKAGIGILAFFGLSDAGKISEVRKEEGIKPKATITMAIPSQIREPMPSVPDTTVSDISVPDTTREGTMMNVRKNNETKIRKDASAWRAAKRLAPEDDFETAWANKDSKVLLPDGREVHISEVNLTHEGDTVRYIAGKGGKAGHFEFEATSGYDPGLEVEVK